MTIKGFGALLVLLMATLAGFLISNRFSGRTKEIRQLENLLLALETEILYGAKPLGEIIRRIGEREKGPIAHICQRIAVRLKEREFTFWQVWEEELRRGWPTTHLKGDEQEVLLQLGSVLGLSDRETQRNHLRLALAHLRAEEKEAMDDQAKYEKLSRTLGFLSGLLLVILMY
ncbi:stage III sporulation protein SpoIIIAB [Thermicanus aegyptius]|uniref:stage III sporulation protein SpoIIIAB n=1 Tax=Thermicanus aegyptius TaxID=94009 RepID=UPI00040AB19E|nr:stage III sporulation protein SpoIIIAB [Thermicanus aegyptius]